MRPSESGGLPVAFRVADWTVHPSACRLVRGDTAVHLRAQVMDLLVVLADRPGAVVTKDEILERVWHGRFVSESALTRTMAELRRVLGDEHDQPRFIETIAKRGYRLIARVEAASATRAPRLAVLPFENLNGDPAYDYFAAGMSDALTTELANVSGLQVISRFSTMEVTPRSESLAAMAGRLRVDAVVEGSALHDGDRVRITAQLIQIEPESHLWARTYVVEMADILPLQGRVARAIAEAVQARLTPQEEARLARPRSVRPDAHVAYLKARYYTLRWDREGLDKGFRYLEQALQIDPDYAAAHALLAQAFTVLGYWGHMPIAAAYPQAKAAAARAVELDDALGEAHAVLGLMYWLKDWDLDAAEAEMRTALSLSPSSELAHGYYALLLAVSRRDPENASTHTRQLLSVDPLSMGSNFFAAWLYFFCGDIDGAIAQAQSTIEMYPTCLHAHYVLGWSALAQGRCADAVAAFERALSWSRDAVSIAYAAVALGRCGETGRARGLLLELSGRCQTTDVPAFLFAMVHASLGDSDAALERLEQVLEARDSRAFWFRFEAIGGALISNPRFVDLMRRVDAPILAAARQRT